MTTVVTLFAPPSPAVIGVCPGWACLLATISTGPRSSWAILSMLIGLMLAAASITAAPAADRRNAYGAVIFALLSPFLLVVAVISSCQCSTLCR